VATWLEDLRECCDNPDISLLLIGNKTDLERIREVATLDALGFARSEKLAIIEMSAKNGENSTKALQLILQDIHAVEQAKQQKLLAGGGTGSQIPGASVVVGNANPQQATEFCAWQSCKQ